MKRKSVLKTIAFFGAILLAVFAYSFTSNKDHLSKDKVNNIVSDDYPSVIIGNQEWMTENLNVDKFRNGDPIPEAKTAQEWEQAGIIESPAWCYYENDPVNGKIYGKLYNWYAVNDPRGLAPEGWHVPSNKEWTVLTEYLGGKEIKEKYNEITFWYTPSAGGKMKSIGTQYWKSPNKDASNSSGFSGLPGGGRGIEGDFNMIGEYGGWWSSSEDDTDKAWTRNLGYLGSIVSSFNNYKNPGLSVRCLRD